MPNYATAVAPPQPELEQGRSFNFKWVAIASAIMSIVLFIISVVSLLYFQVVPSYHQDGKDNSGTIGGFGIGLSGLLIALSGADIKIQFILSTCTTPGGRVKSCTMTCWLISNLIVILLSLAQFILLIIALILQGKDDDDDSSTGDHFDGGSGPLSPARARQLESARKAKIAEMYGRVVAGLVIGCIILVIYSMFFGYIFWSRKTIVISENDYNNAMHVLVPGVISSPTFPNPNTTNSSPQISLPPTSSSFADVYSPSYPPHSHPPSQTGTGV